MKILQFTALALPHLGGIEKYVDNSSKEFITAGHDVTICTSLLPGTPAFQEHGGVKFFRLPSFSLLEDMRFPLPKIFSSGYKKAFKRLDAMDFDIILVHERFYLLSLIGIKYANKRNIPVIMIGHTSKHFTVQNKLLDFFGRLYEHSIAAVIRKYKFSTAGVSRACLNWLKHFKIQGDIVFYNSIAHVNSSHRDFKAELGITTEKIIITYAGRLIPEKGCNLLLEAFDELNLNNIVLLIAGDGKDKNNVISYSKKNMNIKYVGFLCADDIHALYSQTDIFIHPSAFAEGMPTAILEAGMHRCCVITTPAGGSIEIVPDDKHGIIFPIGDKAALKSALHLAISDAGLRKTLADNLFNRVISHFTWPTTARKMLSVIQDIIEE